MEVITKHGIITIIAYNISRKKQIAGLVITWLTPIIIFSVVKTVGRYMEKENAKLAGRVTGAVLISLSLLVIIGVFLLIGLT